MSTINVGIIGTGGLANGRLMPAIAKQPDATILAVCDIDEKCAREAAGKFGVGHVFTDFRKMLEMSELDVVHVCTPNFKHVEPAVDALSAGKHVMVEKPIARNATEAALITGAAAQSGKKLMVGQNIRFTP